MSANVIVSEYVHGNAGPVACGPSCSTRPVLGDSSVDQKTSFSLNCLARPPPLKINLNLSDYQGKEPSPSPFDHPCNGFLLPAGVRFGPVRGASWSVFTSTRLGLI